MITIAICDSEVLFRKNIIACCGRYLQDKNEEYRILEYESGEDVLMASFPDILLLDVKQKGINGLLIKEILWKKGADTRIVFVSDSKQWMQEAFGKNVFGYLIKPVKYTSFCERMDMVFDDFRAKQRGTYCKTGNIIRYILFKDIEYIRANGRYTEVFLQNQETSVTCSIGVGQWEELYGTEGFVRVNRRYIINPAYVIGIEQSAQHGKYIVQLIDGMEIAISSKYEEPVWEKYREWKAEYR